MSWREVVVSSRAKLELKNNHLVVRGDTVRKVFLNDISVLIIENTGSAVTVALLEALWKRKINVIFCDKKRYPGAQLVPFYGSHDTSARIRDQINWNKDLVDLLWTRIIEKKIMYQAKVLLKIGKKEEHLTLVNYAKEIEVGDKTNREGHAAKVYFNALFGSSFSRDKDCFINSALNYAYGVLLSTVTRDIVSNGYLSQLGLFHSSVYNPYNLGCDLMEPIRPLFDFMVLSRPIPVTEELDQETKYTILETLNTNVHVGVLTNSLINGISAYVRSVFNALEHSDLNSVRFVEYEL